MERTRWSSLMEPEPVLTSSVKTVRLSDQPSIRYIEQDWDMSHEYVSHGHVCWVIDVDLGVSVSTIRRLIKHQRGP